MAAYLAYGEDADYIGVDYGKPPPKIPQDVPVRIIDFSYSREILAGLKETNPDLVVLDHHKTAQEDLRGLEHAVFDMEKSGAVLAWEEFHPGSPVPPFFLYLQDRDLWKFELPYSREIAAAVSSHSFDFREWAKICDDVNKLHQDGIVCLRMISSAVDIMVKNSQRVIFNGTCQDVTLKTHAGSFGVIGPNLWAGPASNASVFFSEVGERLLELYPEAPFSAYYFDRGDGRRQWGMRSRKDFDCAVIAKLFGGGGHAQASGFTQESPSSEFS